MSDSRKSTIVLASILKPVDDSRLHEKIGLSIAETGKYEVHVIGIRTDANNSTSVIWHGVRPFRRFSIRRLFAPWRILFTALKLKPRLFIVATHELLYVAMVVKLVLGCRVIYDVQENYYWNILYTPAFPLLVKPFVALYVRGKETLTARFVDHFFLAEKGYQGELKFPGSRATVLENKVRISPDEARAPADVKSKSTVNLLFSGTIAETTGIFTAIDLAVKLHVMDERIRLTIIGYCAQQDVLEKVRLLITPRPFITLTVGDGPIPHGEIFRHIRASDFGIISYQVNPSTMNSIPTKLYEYLGFRLPILLVSHKPWVDYAFPYNASIVFGATHFDASQIYREMMDRTFYTSQPTDVYWQTEEPRLLAVVESLLG